MYTSTTKLLDDPGNRSIPDGFCSVFHLTSSVYKMVRVFCSRTAFTVCDNSFVSFNDFGFVHTRKLELVDIIKTKK